MSLPRELTMELMAYADGELDADAVARVEGILAQDPEARRVVAALSGDAVGDFLREASDAAGERAEAAGMLDAVMTRVAAEAMRPKVASLNAARAKREAKTRLIGAGVIILALAAAVTLYVRTQRSATAPDTNTQAQIAPAATVAPPQPTQGVAPSVTPTLAPAGVGEVTAEEGVEVNDIDSPSQDVSVYYLRSNSAGATKSPGGVVIWLGGTAPSQKTSPKGN